MKKAKIVILSILGLALVAVLSIAGTIAYLQADDEDINVMTMGNVKIAQLEYERVVDSNGNPVKGVVGTDFKANYGITESYKLQEFTQAKPAYPAVYTNENKSQAWDEFQQLWNQVGAPGSNDLFDDSMKNVVDKFVFVKNTGKSDAYYRTIIAIECPEGIDSKIIHLSLNLNNRFDRTEESEKKSYFVGYTTINGIRYALYNMTYNQVLVPGEVSRPSLLQVFLDPETKNEDCEKFGETWDILVKTQAVQTKGFGSAASALDTAFGKVTEENVNIWFGETNVPTMVSTVGQLTEALANGEDIVLTEDVEINTGLSISSSKNVTLDLNGHEIKMTTNEEKATSLIDNKGSLTITNGTLSYESTVPAPGPYYPYGTNTINNSGNLVIDGVDVINTTNGGSSNAIDNAPGSKLIVNSGKIISTKVAIRARDGAEVTINGGEIVGSYGVQVYIMHKNNQTTNLTINGGTISGTSLSDNGKTLAVYSYAVKNNTDSSKDNTHANTNITITGGKFNDNVEFHGGAKGTFENVSITGGTYSGRLGFWKTADDFVEINNDFEGSLSELVTP